MKKLLTVVLCIAMTVSMLAGCGKNSSGSGSSGGTQGTGNSQNKAGTDRKNAEGTQGQADADGNAAASDNGEIVTINFYTMNMGAAKEYKDVEAAINEIIEKEIGVRINWTMLDIGQWFQQYSMLISGSEEIDLMPTLGQFTTAVAQGAFLELDDLYEQYGNEIKPYFDAYIDAGKVDGHLYGIPALKDWACGWGILYRKDVVEELGLDVSQVKTLEDFTPILEAVRDAHPEMAPFVSAAGNTMNNLQRFNWDQIGGDYGVLMDQGQSLEVVNLYETEEYQSMVHTFRNWYNDGLIARDTATSTETYQTLIKAGKAFSSWNTYHPGTIGEHLLSCGTEMGLIELVSPFITTSGVNTLMWGIPATSKNPEAAMKLLNFMYSNSEVEALLCFGIEGVHYQVNENGKADFLEGQDQSSCGYHPDMNWVWPNNYIGLEWEGTQEGLGEAMIAFNNNAIKSKALGFPFNSDPVINEVTACMNVIKEYAYPLEAGAVDPDETLPRFLEALQDAGIEKIIAEKQAQLDAWAASK